MGYVFEELIRKFNEENNEEAGVHFTPHELIELMAHLVFDPIKEQLPLTMTIDDPACGSGGMLTESQALSKRNTRLMVSVVTFPSITRRSTRRLTRFVSPT